MKRKQWILTFFVSAFFGTAAFAQTQPTTVYNGDTINYYSLPIVDIYANVHNNAPDDLKKYLKLRRDVIKAYPYAKLAAAELKFINDSVAKMQRNREQKRFIKEREKILKDKFEKDLKNLTVTQGKILIKLIDRETGETSYKLVKELRGSLTAFSWQVVGKFFGITLKSHYDPDGEDKAIEQIVQSIERGELQVRK
jgi:hypothetical protein